MQGSKKIPIIDLNQHITCRICNGYFVDATTIIECLHTFCRSCIVRYLENNKYCPVCDVQVHKTKPLLNIRPDKTLQDVVYKLVPRLFQNEMQRRREFYENHPEAKPSSLEQCGEASYQHLLTPEETVCLTLSYHGANGTPRYLRCPAAVSLGHLKKLIRAKYDLTEHHKVEILYNQDCLNSSLTLMDVAYIYLWKRKGPIELSYRIYECTAKKLKLEPDHAETSQTNNNNWKEVQLRISENGEMSITGIQDSALSPSLLEIVNSDQKYKNEVVTVVESKSSNKSTSVTATKKELPGLKYIGKSTNALTSNSTSINVPTMKKQSCEMKSNDAAAPSTTSVSLSKIPDGTLRLETSSVEVSAPTFLTSCATLSFATTTTVFSTINNSKCSTKSDDATSKVEPVKMDVTPAAVDDDTNVAGKEKGTPTIVNNNIIEKNLKRKNDSVLEVEPPNKLPKQTILNHSIGLLNLSNNHPLKKHSKLNRNGENLKEILPKTTGPTMEIVTVSAAAVTTTSSRAVPATIRTSTAATTTDVMFSKPSPINKNFVNIQLSRPGTPIVTSKPSIMSTKLSVTPPKTPVSSYGGGKSPCYMPKTYNPVINVPKPMTSTSIAKSDGKPPSVPKNEVKTPASSISIAKTTASASFSTPKVDSKPTNATSSQHQQLANLNNKLTIKSKPSTPIGYKTLRDPPKSWNSQISKANLNKPSPDPKYSDLKNVRPAKFFKMRNNMPRYLGNPASGVKPMYQVHVSPEKEKSPQEANKVEKSEIRKHSIVKIDPKTLKPISEKAPETTSLSNHCSSNHSSQGYMNQAAANPSISTANQNMSGPNPSGQSDLKINTSSVSIFNPLKLQSSPKNERKSPKSPHSPKLKAQSTNSPTGNKRDKVNLNFTPPNPFIPNLASPTMSPNQFLYPTGPPGFPTYDPRMMAAYHSLWYGQRMAFPTSPIPGLSLDLNQRKNFEMLPSPTSPKMGVMLQQGHSPQISTKLASTTSSNISSISRAQNLLPAASKPPPVSKKAPKEPKNEKSLETTVEKLTQNRNKEISGKSDASGGIKNVEKFVNREKEKQLENVEGSKEKEKAGEKALERVGMGVESEGKENLDKKGGDSTSPSNSSPEKSKSEGPDKRAAEVKSSENSEKTVKVSVSTDSVKKSSPCIDRDKEATSGSISVKSKNVSNNSNNNKNSEEIVEGGK